MKKSYSIQYINQQYVSDECVQLMFAYSKALLILKKEDNDKETLVYYDNNFDEEPKLTYYNAYINDNRRFQFPYSNIPIHNTKIGLKKYKVVNQLLEYDTIYRIKTEINGNIYTQYCKVLKDKEKAIAIQDLDLSSLFFMTTDELKNLNIQKAKEPKISKRLNKGFSNDELNKNKKLVKN